jgi:hypothetical protein
MSSEGGEARSGGRYCIGKTSPVKDTVVYETNGNYSISADYSRFSGSRAASVEIHGGATLEEVLVPIIELTLADSDIHVALEGDIIEVSYKTKPVLVLIITPDCENITVAVGNKTYRAERIEKSRYSVTFPELKKGRYTLDVFENQNKIASKDFTIKSKGLTQRDIL